MTTQPLIATFSIVARDPENGDVGVAVASKFLAVGVVVPWARAGVGAVATQAWGNIRFGPDGLEILARGLSAQDTVELLLAADPGREHRQLGIVDNQGRAASWTGSACMAWAGGRTGPGYAIQGNILTGPEVVEAMEAAFTSATGELAERMLAALLAGDAAGGDSRGRQSAALYVARAGGSYGGGIDRYVDLRVDDHAAPVQELGRLLELHRFYLSRPDPATLLEIDAALASELQEILKAVGHYSGPISGVFDAATRAALDEYGGIANIEERLTALPKLDPLVLAFLRERQREASAGLD